MSAATSVKITVKTNGFSATVPAEDWPTCNQCHRADCLHVYSEQLAFHREVCEALSWKYSGKSTAVHVGSVLPLIAEFTAANRVKQAAS